MHGDDLRGGCFLASWRNQAVLALNQMMVDMASCGQIGVPRCEIRDEAWLEMETELVAEVPPGQWERVSVVGHDGLGAEEVLLDNAMEEGR